MKKGTGFVLLGAIVLILVWDLFRVMQDGGYDNTVSAWFHDMSRDWPIIPFLFGIVFGHFFWSKPGKVVQSENKI